MSALDKTASFLKNHVGHLHMPLGRLIECGSHNLCLYTAAHIRDLLRTLVNQENYLVNFRMVVSDRVSYRFEKHSLTGFRLGDDETSLTLADGSEHVNDPA